MLNHFAEKNAKKRYLAVIHGVPPWEPKHPLEYPLARVDEDEIINVRMVVRDDALPSLTQITIVEKLDGYTLVECVPITGRQHQIRAHLAAAGYPIVGDKLYCHGDDAFREFCAKGLTPELAKQFILPRQALHAAEIRIPHPTDKREVRIQAPLPKDMQDFIDAHHLRDE